MKKSRSLKPFHVFVLLMVVGILLTLNSYDLGKQAGTQEIVTHSTNGVENHRWEIDEKKIEASTEAYQKVGCMLLLIGGIGLVSVQSKPTS